MDEQRRDDDREPSFDQEIGRRLVLAASLFDWSNERVSGFRSGVTAFRSGSVDPMKIHRHIPDRDGFVERNMSAPVKDALGYSDGVAAARSMLACDAGDDMPRERDAILHQVSIWQGNGNADFDIEEADWIANVADEVRRFHSIMSPDEWRKWLIEEHKFAIEAGRSGYAHLVLQDILEPVVYAQYPDGLIDVWDGWHRIAASVVRESDVIPSIRGVPPPSAQPRP